MKTFDERFKSIQAKARTKKRNKAIFVSATAGVCVLALLLVLFVPFGTTPPSVRQYAGSEYYGVIQKLNEYTYEKPKYKNNFQALMAGLSSFGMNKGAEVRPPIMNMLPEAAGPVDGTGAVPDSSNGGDSYQEVTDNQVAGVIEADIFKRSDKYIYHLMGNVLDIYTIAGEDSAKVSRTNITELMEAWLPNTEGTVYISKASFSPQEMYLSMDCKTVTLVGTVYYGLKKTSGYPISLTGVALVTLDVSDPGNGARLVNKQLFTGDYVSSRMVDGEILLVYRQNNYRNTIDFDDETTFIPQYGWFEDMKSIAAENIILPEAADNANYTVVTKLGADLEIHGIKALLSYNQNVYVSQDNIFLTHAYTMKEENAAGTKVTQTQMTEITGICYSGEELETLGTIHVEGSVKDQYSMDEYEGVLRVVTTTQESIYYPVSGNVSSLGTKGDSANLYCIDLAQWKIVGSVLEFAPAGESVTSVRFDGTAGYVCTAELVLMTDPVYFFDLSDPTNITYTDTGTIDGYSTSLIQFGGGNLLGIGLNERGELKIEVYKEGEDKVDSVCVFERACDYPTLYKSYYVDRENQYVGLGIYDWEDGKMHYLLLHFDGQQLNVVLDHVYEDFYWGMNNFRADIIDGYLYILWQELDVVKV